MDFVACPQGRSVALCAVVAKSALTHFITSPFLSFFTPSFSMLYFGGVSQASLQTLLYLFPPFIYSWLGPPAAILRQMYLPHKLSSFDIPHPVFSWVII